MIAHHSVIVYLLAIAFALSPGVSAQTEDHFRHWVAENGVIISGAGEQWREGSEAGAAHVAVFDTASRSRRLSLDADRTWGGMLVDAEDVVLDLAGGTLRLTTNTTEDFSISVGRQIHWNSRLVLSNGVVIAPRPIWAGRFAGGFNTPSAPTATLILDAAQVEAPAVVLAGPNRTEGALQIQKGATLTMDRLEVAIGRWSEGSVLVRGEGSGLRVEGASSTIGRDGDAEVYIISRAVADWGSALVTLDARPGGNTLLTVMQPGTVSTGGSFRVGYCAGIRIDSDAAFHTPGAVTVAGGALQISDSTVELGQLELYEGSAYLGAAAQVTITNAVFTNGVFTVDGEGTTVNIVNPLVISNSSVQIDHSGVLEVNGAHIAPGGWLRGNYGTLKSTGRVISEGVVSPGNKHGPVGFLTIEGDFEQTKSGVLEFEITAENQDQLTVVGNARLEGVIHLRVQSPRKAGETFTLVTTTGSLTGSPTFLVDGVEPGWSYEVERTESTLVVRSLNDGRAVKTVSTPSGQAIGVWLWDTDAATFELLTQPAHGTVSIQPPDQLYYTSSPGFVGTDQVQYRNSNGVPTTVQFTVEPRLLPPTITMNASEEMFVDEGHIVQVTGTFTDPPGNGPVTLYAPVGEIIQDNQKGTWRWTFPAMDGPDDKQEFAFSAEDELAIAFVFFELYVRNVPPTARGLTALQFVDEPVAIDLTATDPGDDTLSYQIVSPPKHGVLSGTGPLMTFTPDPHYVGSDSFTYKVMDSDGAESYAVVRIADLREGAEPVAIEHDGTNCMITFQGLPGSVHRVESTEDLKPPITWGEIGRSPPNPDDQGIDSGRFIFTDNAPTVQRFYRAVPE